MDDKEKAENVAPSGTGAQGERLEFTTEIRKLLDILIHSLYTHKEIFLRELISNASDALDKAHFRSLVEKNLRDPEIPLEIRLEVDKDNKVLTVSDTGIGMTRQELVENIGTIAHSGSLSFLQSVAQNQSKPSDFNLIGQFGVGFYSVFMVAKKVEILTLPADPNSGANLWCCEGGGDYTIVPSQKEKRGTEIRVYLKDEETAFLEINRLRDVVRHYSDFISYPIKLKGEQVNKLSALWSRASNEIKEEEYDEFYNYLAHTQEKPLSHIHLSFDAPLQFRGILFIPRTIPWDMRFELPEKWKGVHLYVKRVFIQADCEELMPNYLRFVRGIVESDDLPINISRETLQENQIIMKIRKSLVRKVLDHLETLSKDKADDYHQLWRNFGKFLKQGYRLDYENREKLAVLFRFNSSACKDEKELISLNDYVSRMLPGQTKIYYVSGEDRQAIETSPHLEIFRRKGIEVLYMSDPVDDFLCEDLRDYQGKQLAGIDQEDLALDDVKPRVQPEEQKEEKKPEQNVDVKDSDIESFLGFLKTTLHDRVSDVRISKRLTGSPCCLVSSKEAPGVGMQRFMKMMNEKYEMPKRVLEINRDNVLIQVLAKLYVAKPQAPALAHCCHQLLDNTLLLEGSPLDTRGMVPRLQEMMETLTQLLLKQ
jgi:molecular chaperone HtpG